MKCRTIVLGLTALVMGCSPLQKHHDIYIYQQPHHRHELQMGTDRAIEYRAFGTRIPSRHPDPFEYSISFNGREVLALVRPYSIVIPGYIKETRMADGHKVSDIELIENRREQSYVKRTLESYFPARPCSFWTNRTDDVSGKSSQYNIP